jgi:methyl-accepting chemotaxis protein
MLLGSFASMGLVVLVVALLGLNGSSKLNRHIKTLGTNALPSVSGWKSISEGLTAIHAAEQALVNAELDQASRKAQIEEITAAFKRIDEGTALAEATESTPGEKPLHDKFVQDWDKWKQNHEQFMQLNQEFERFGIRDPLQVQLNLIAQGKANSPEMGSAKNANTALDKLYAQANTKNLPSYQETKASLQELVDLNTQVGEQAKQQADNDVTTNNFWLIVIVIAGPVTAIGIGFVLSSAIARSMNVTIDQTLSKVAKSLTEIATTVEQQERTISQQASSVTQTTTTMDELGASSRQSAEQAEASASGARMALSLAEDGTLAVQETLEGMSTLKDKVGAIAEQILRLSEQTQQIGGISGLVGDLANQTNMLALNAAVEAARAGEHGKGFGVVAGEIRKLADQSKKSAEKINALVGDIQAAINTTVMVTDEGTKNVDSGMKLTQSNAVTFAGVADAVNNVFLNSQQISLSAKQQAVAVQQVVAAMNEINLGSKESASGITQIRVSTEQLKETTQKLKASV